MRHVDLRPEDVRAVRKLSRAHAPQEIEILVDAAVAIWAFRPRGRHGPTMLADLLVRLRVDVRPAFLDQELAELIELLEIIARVQLRVPFEAEPSHVVLDGID